jgi:hypothetical protein
MSLSKGKSSQLEKSLSLKSQKEEEWNLVSKMLPVKVESQRHGATLSTLQTLLKWKTLPALRATTTLPNEGAKKCWTKDHVFTWTSQRKDQTVILCLVLKL